ncbi:MAG: LON peptidase substrate-binding domain-containing protein [Pseudomonadota bacterium]
MKIKTYETPGDIPPVVPVFPLTAALLLPRGQMPLNIFEPRYLAMIDAALASDRVIGMVQPKTAISEGDEDESPQEKTPLCAVGCLGRMTAFQETPDGRYLITLSGICRFRVNAEMDVITPYRQCRIDVDEFAGDLVPNAGADTVDRDRLLTTFRAYLDANAMEADWSSVEQASNEALVNALSMMSPYGPREKQALLEASDLKARADILVAITEMALKLGDGPSTEKLQ